MVRNSYLEKIEYWKREIEGSKKELELLKKRFPNHELEYNERYLTREINERENIVSMLYKEIEEQKMN